MGKKAAKPRSLSALAAGLSGRQVQRVTTRTSGKAAPKDPLVAALARTKVGGEVAQKITAGLATRSAPSAAARPATPGRPTALRAVPVSRPGASTAVAARLAGTTRTASQVASIVKTVENSHAAPAKAMGRAAAQSLAESRRRYPRADLQVQAKLALADNPTHTFDAALPTQNLSVGGMFLASTFFLRVGTRLEVRLSLPPHGREVHVKGQVVRQEPGGFAVSFTDYLEGSEVVLATHFLSPVLRDFIARYAKENGFKPSVEYVANTADVLAAWELRRAQLGGDVWVVPGDHR